MELTKEEEQALKNMLKDKINFEEKTKKDKTVFDGKQVEWYAALVNANINTRFEKDRQLLPIASLAMGILVSFMRDIQNYYSFVLWLFSCLCFLSTIILSLNIFQKNQYVLEDTINSRNTDRLDASLKKMDNWMYWGFVLGVFSLLTLALLNFNFNNFA